MSEAGGDRIEPREPAPLAASRGGAKGADAGGQVASRAVSAGTVASAGVVGSAATVASAGAVGSAATVGSAGVVGSAGTVERRRGG
jgi:hypothetical protein